MQQRIILLEIELKNSLENIIVATTKEWNIQNYFILNSFYRDKFHFHLFTSPEELDFNIIKTLNPKYIFFPHWSWKIPENIYENFECIIFHMTDLPFGRGGTPLQNLIINKVYHTKITALKAVQEIDSGAIYLQEDFDISQGSAQEIFEDASKIIFEKLIPKFLQEKLVAFEQEGDVVLFQRRKPEQSDLHVLSHYSLNTLYDFIRMLDADGYPKAYVLLNNCKIEFSKVQWDKNKLIGQFEVIENE